jgi:acyl-CoA dehydrogenase
MARASAAANDAMEYLDEGDSAPKKERDPSKPSETNRTAAIGAEELAWADAAMMLCLPGPGLGGPPVRATGTPSRRSASSACSRTWTRGRCAGARTRSPSRARAATSRASARAAARTATQWVLNGRKCYITNGARASWVVAFATVDPSLGRAGHRAFVVEKGTPGFWSARSRRRWACARTRPRSSCSRTAASRRRTCSAARRYQSKEGFMTAMKTFDNTRPLVAAMASASGAPPTSTRATS